MVTCDLYARVSLEIQAEEGHSLKEQEDRLRAYAESQGWVINACYVDPGYTGAKLDRPGIQAVIRDAQEHRIQKVVTYKLDRLSRSQKDTLYLIEDVFLANGVDYVSMTESLDTGTPLGMAMIGILSAFAQLERQQIKERMMLGRIASAKEGNFRGGSGVPIGYRYIPKTGSEQGQLVIDQDEAEVVRTIFRLFLEGKSFHAIYDYCKEQNYQTSYGSFGGGGANLIPAMLSNRGYIGEIRYCGQWYPGRHESIIDRKTFDRVQDKLVEYRATLDEHRRVPYKAEHLLTGLLYCGDCGSKWCYHSVTAKLKSGTKKYETYCCYTRNAHKTMRTAARCGVKVWHADELEDVVWQQILSLQYEDRAPDPDASEARIEALQAKLAKLDQQQERLLDLYVLGTFSMDSLQKKSESIEADRRKYLDQIEVLRHGSTRLTAAEAMDVLSRVRVIRESGTPEEQRDIVRMLIKRITLGRERTVTIEWNI